MAVFPDPSTPFGERVAQRMHDDMVIWLTTMGTDGTPQPNPVWFLREDDTLLVYSQPIAHKLRHIARDPRVSLNLNSDENGDDVVVLTGTARVESGHPLPTQYPPYIAKYAEAAKHIAEDVDSYSVAIKVDLDKVRGF